MRRLRSGLVAIVVSIASLVLGAVPAVAASSTTLPTLTGTVAVGQTVRADPGTWDTEGLTFSYAWLLDGAPIPGGTGPDYTPTVADQGHALSVRVAAAQEETPAGEATSDSVTVLGEAPAAMSVPEITGGTYAGETVQASDVEWSRAGLDFTYRWLRDGEPIAGAEAASYTLTNADWCRDLAVVVTAHEAGHADGTVTSTTRRTSCVIIERCTPTALRVRPVHEVVTTRQHQKLKVHVVDPGNRVVRRGTVTVRVTPERILRTVRLRPADRGRLTIRLPRLDPGRHLVRARFDAPPGSGWLDATNATSFRVKRSHH